MDNDSSIKKKLVKFYKIISFKFQFYNKRVFTPPESNKLISDVITGDKPMMVSRFGATELLCVDSFLNGKKYSKETKYRIKNHAGVFPDTDCSLNEFSKIYLNAIKDIDMLAVWGIRNERKIIDRYCKVDTRLIDPIGLEPYYFKECGWSKALEDKKVLIIHPFKDSILKQYKNRKNIFDEVDLLPNFKSLDVIKSVQSIAGEECGFDNWVEAYKSMCNEIDKIDFDIAIVGAGAYGLPLCSYIKLSGKKAIHMGGATQILFGIKGMRWDNHKFISSLYNEFWKRPDKKEVPDEYKRVEGGSYW